MPQNITLKIGGREYAMVAATPEMEQRLRLAAEEINAMLQSYDVKYPEKSAVDKFAFVALNETVNKLSIKDSARALKDEADGLAAELDSYLKGIESSR